MNEVSDQAMTDRADALPATGSVTLPWLVVVLAAVHAAAAVTDLVPGGAGNWPAVLDGAVAVTVSAAALAIRFGIPQLSATGPAAVSLSLVLVAAGLASGVRVSGSGQVWAGSDVVLAVIAACGLATRGAFLLGVIGAELTWAIAVAVRVVTVGRLGPEPADLVLSGILALAAAAAAVVLRRGFAAVHQELASSRQAIELRAVTDPLTGTSNRRGLELVALPMIEHARRQGEAVHCLFIDLDDFRAINDELGRNTGDEVLAAVSEAVLASVRATDVVARWAGDQFVVLGPGTGTSPLEMERRVRAQLANDPPVPQQVWDGRVSIGSATLVPWDEGNLDSLLGRAEEDMQLRRSLRRQSRARSQQSAPTLGRAPGVERRIHPPTADRPPTA
jgi:diguanylate cyclase (GGDEF)-like protein